MMNPAIIMKLMGAKKQFESTHPKFVAFFQQMIQQGVEAGSVIEINVTKSDGSVVTANMRVQQSDLDLVAQLKELSKDA